VMSNAHPTGCANIDFLESIKAAGPGFVCGFGKLVTVGLQNAFEVYQETHGPFAPAPHEDWKMVAPPGVPYCHRSPGWFLDRPSRVCRHLVGLSPTHGPNRCSSKTAWCIAIDHVSDLVSHKEKKQ
jgi:hypothetical protein